MGAGLAYMSFLLTSASYIEGYQLPTSSNTHQAKDHAREAIKLLRVTASPNTDCSKGSTMVACLLTDPSRSLA